LSGMLIDNTHPFSPGRPTHKFLLILEVVPVMPSNSQKGLNYLTRHL
jgi:hypothetical protein